MISLTVWRRVIDCVFRVPPAYGRRPPLTAGRPVCWPTLNDRIALYLLNIISPCRCCIINWGMWLSKHAGELIQRATCHFKPNTYFLHNNAPLPSILVVLPNRIHRIAPLLNRLTQQENFLFNEQLRTVKCEPLSDI
jgi:hypothetical protein